MLRLKYLMRRNSEIMGKIKEWWKRQKNWVKGGFAATTFVLGMYLILKLLGFVSELILLPKVMVIPFTAFSFSIWAIMTYLSLPLIIIFHFLLGVKLEYLIVGAHMGGESGSLPTLLGIVLIILIWFLIGAVIGFITDKVKPKKK